MSQMCAGPGVYYPHAGHETNRGIRMLNHVLRIYGSVKTRPARTFKIVVKNFIIATTIIIILIIIAVEFNGKRLYEKNRGIGIFISVLRIYWSLKTRPARALNYTYYMNLIIVLFY